LFEVVIVLENNKKNWSDNSNKTMVEFMHQKVMKAIKVVVGVIC
jgi:hypothetical protein